MSQAATSTGLSGASTANENFCTAQRSFSSSCHSDLGNGLRDGFGNGLRDDLGNGLRDFIGVCSGATPQRIA